MIHKQLPPLILLLIFTCPLSCQNSPSESFDVWSFFNDKIILTFDEIIGQFIVFVNAIDKYINLSWDKVMLIMDRIVDHARDEDCYYACPRGLHPIPKSGYKARFFGCTVFGYEVSVGHHPNINAHGSNLRCHIDIWSSLKQLELVVTFTMNVTNLVGQTSGTVMTT